MGWSVEKSPEVSSCAAGGLEVIDHFFGKVAVLAKHEVHVIGHDRASVAGVMVFADCVGECDGDEVDLLWAEPTYGEQQTRSGLRVEVADFFAGGMHLFTAVMEFAEFGQQRRGNGV